MDNSKDSGNSGLTTQDEDNQNHLKISIATKVRKPSCKHVDGQCDLDL